MEGDKITVSGTDFEAGKQPLNVMTIKKAE
jgi:hypothetical protein